MVARHPCAAPARSAGLQAIVTFYHGQFSSANRFRNKVKNLMVARLLTAAPAQSAGISCAQRHLIQKQSTENRRKADLIRNKKKGLSVARQVSPAVFVQRCGQAAV